MDFSVGGIDHYPLIVRLVYHDLQQSFPNAFVAPAAKAPWQVLPVSVVRGQVPPWGTSAPNPEHSIDEQAVVLSDSAPNALTPGQMRLQQPPYWIGYIVPAMRCSHA